MQAVVRQAIAAPNTAAPFTPRLPQVSKATLQMKDPFRLYCEQLPDSDHTLSNVYFPSTEMLKTFIQASITSLQIGGQLTVLITGAHHHGLDKLIFSKREKRRLYDVDTSNIKSGDFNIHEHDLSESNVNSFIQKIVILDTHDIHKITLQPWKDAFAYTIYEQPPECT